MNRKDFIKSLVGLAVLASPIAATIVKDEPPALPKAPCIPIGYIEMYAGDKIPAGWALCDGTNGTPDLRSQMAMTNNSNYGKDVQKPSFTIKYIMKMF